MITIRNIRTIITAPAGLNLIVVKVETSEPELYGLGCATFAYRHLAVKSVVEDYLKPLLVGRDVSRIEDIWQLSNYNGYWRNGPITNNAVSGVDMALWDIKGKMAKMPVYQLLGGKCRDGVPIYRQTGGKSLEEIIEKVEMWKEQGLRHLRLQWGGGYSGKKAVECSPPDIQPGIYLDNNEYIRNTVHMFDGIRARLGDEMEFCHDVHERIAPADAVRLSKMLEPYRLFFLEDAFSPEQGEWLRICRQQSCTPVAQGELYNNPLEWQSLITERLIDFVRVHISQIGGLTPARKLAVFAEQFGVRTAWHGPGDVSPVGHACNLHVDYAISNLGIQEWTGFTRETQDVFPGCPWVEKGYAYVNEAPGFGIDVDEKEAAKYPPKADVVNWTQTRLTDGTFQRP